MSDTTLVCPECGSDRVTVSHLQRFMANTGEHYCHSVKTHDVNSESTCLTCGWQGQRRDLSEVKPETHARIVSEAEAALTEGAQGANHG